MTYPKTIDELKMWAEDHNLPLDDMRTYIGTDYRGAKAYGIYEEEETGKFIVYKNKADGTRAVRYEGYDQAYAVNELYMKMQERIEQQNQINHAPAQDNRRYRHRRSGLWKPFLLFFIVYAASFSFYFIAAKYDQRPDSGYYFYDDTYYCQDDDFYYYDDDDASWYYANYVDNELMDNYSDYYESSGYYDSYDITNFQDSGYYEQDAHKNNDYDNDDDWDNDWNNNWNDSYDDWDSDW
ncbi:MAG: hypothetical protein NC225_08535 [Clostridium sp.]|nr:hypothetical protein [Clostridium sp.]MCM1399511.1 hypothetical protein [Clostridium sp.]MCM1460065.1 hypothetical protein [Bacteroides sp.]